jgi:signal transduction histidine kinase
MGGVPRARSELGRSPRDRPEPDAGHATLEERRAQFLAAFSHELRTPLTTIVSFIELLRAEADGLSMASSSSASSSGTPTGCCG